MADRTRRDLSLRNTMMSALPEQDYIKNPLTFAQIRGDFSLAMTNFMLSVIAQLQDKVNSILAGGPVLNPSELHDGMFQVDVPLQQLGIIPQRYGALEEAIDGLMAMKMSYRSVDESGVSYDTQRNIFYEISVPTECCSQSGEALHFRNGVRRKGYIRIKIYEECARDIFNLKRGYIEHLKGIARLCKLSRTPRLYIYLSAWRRQGRYEAKFNDLKEFLGLLVYDRTRTRVIKSQYEKFSVFLRDVLNPVQKEMKRLADANLIEFYFEYEPIYRHLGQGRGNPDRIAFKLISTQKGVAFEQERRYRQLHSTLIDSFGLLQSEWQRIFPLLTPYNVRLIDNELPKLVQEVASRDVTCPHAYATTSLLRLLKSDSVLTASNMRPVVSQSCVERWNRFLFYLKGKISTECYNTFVSCLELWDYKDQQVIICVPSRWVYDQLMQQSRDIFLQCLHAAFPQASTLSWHTQNS